MRDDEVIVGGSRCAAHERTVSRIEGVQSPQAGRDGAHRIRWSAQPLVGDRAGSGEGGGDEHLAVVFGCELDRLGCGESAVEPAHAHEFFAEGLGAVCGVALHVSVAGEPGRAAGLIEPDALGVVAEAAAHRVGNRGPRCGPASEISAHIAHTTRGASRYARDVTDEPHREEDLIDELDIIEEQPLEARAPMYGRIHERLQAELDA